MKIILCDNIFFELKLLFFSKVSIEFEFKKSLLYNFNIYYFIHFYE